MDECWNLNQTKLDYWSYCVYIPLLFYSFHSDSRIFRSTDQTFDFEIWQVLVLWLRPYLQAQFLWFLLGRNLRNLRLRFQPSKGWSDVFQLIMVPDNDQTWPLPIELNMSYPLVNSHITMENHHAINGKIHYKWPFSIAMLVYQRVINLIIRKF